MTALYSAVSGASWANPHDFAWSKDGWPPRPGMMRRIHWPFQSGYFDMSCAQPSVSVTHSAAASASEAIELRKFMTDLPVAATWRDEGELQAVVPLRSAIG